ncbi:MAG: alpha/beta hydrolase [Woeseia sp.]
MNISLRARFIRYLAKLSFARVTPNSDLQETRELFESTAGRYGPPRSVSVRQADIAGVSCDWLVPAGCDKAPLLYYLHGGAYIMGSSRTHRRLVAHIAGAAGVRAVLPNYRLAPEHPYPAGIEDASNVYRELLQQGEQPSRICIAGDSAGGGLTMATLLNLRHAAVELPAATVLLSPWLDLSASGESIHTRADVEPLFKAEHMPHAADFYCQPGQRREPLASPVFADVSGLPRTLIQVGDHEILLSDSTRIADKLKAAGVSVDLQVWPEMWHVFQFFVRFMPEATRAVAEMGLYIKDALREPASQKPD